MSQTVTPNGHSYVFPDDFEGYLYFSKWPLLLADMLAEVENATTAADTATAKAGEATTAAGAAAASELKASEWSDKVGEVEPGRYSAMSWADTAEGHATTAGEHADTTLTYRDDAYLWGNAGEDVAVDDGTHTGFSAYHWSAKAEQSAQAAATSSGIPAIQAGDGGKFLGVKADETGLEYAELAAVGATLVAASTALEIGKAYRITAAVAATLTLPATPAAGDAIRIIDGESISDAVQHVVARNGNTIMGLAEDLTLDTVGIDFVIWFNGTDWRLF